jgi:hypothetical protein
MHELPSSRNHLLLSYDDSAELTNASKRFDADEMIRRDARQEGGSSHHSCRAPHRLKMISHFGTTRASSWRYAREPVTGNGWLSPDSVRASASHTPRHFADCVRLARLSRSMRLPSAAAECFRWAVKAADAGTRSSMRVGPIHLWRHCPALPPKQLLQERHAPKTVPPSQK